MKTYVGARGPAGALVYVDGKPLPVRLDLYNHSPDGFEWGYGGSGPSQLALAILADHFGDGKQALPYYQDFKFRVIAAIRTREWTLTSSQINDAIKAIDSDRTTA